ncbi:MAG: Gfo/Idh/MocA family protein [Caldicoprobacterales bacterium]|mgnify:FL=1|jgi:1,5-anhydro-D-fructose reductase (1,5-anhydro-D-mannitol-forming)|nr:Gfo/Idh/MocA family oxidoreductase [Clostridiales bacterium]
MLKVAMLSYWHVHAWDYTKQLMARDDVKITAVWDEIPERGEKNAKEIGAAFEADLDALLGRNDVDAVVINTPTNMHREVMVAAAKAGKHIFTEKVMALTVRECEEIAQAVREAGVKFCISFPHRTMPHNLFAKKVVDEGLIGDITLLRIRNAHNGSVAGWLPDHFYDPVECGGGAMIDLGAHGMYLSRWLLGEPVRITSMFNNYIDKPVEDNAVSVIEFKNKAIAINETGFVTSDSPFSLELYGTHGSLFIGGADNQIRLVSSKMESQVPGWITPTQLPDPLPSAIDQWVEGILRDGEILFGLEDGIELTRLMEGAYKSHREKSIVEV